MKRAIRWYDYITVNIYWLGLSTIAQTMTPLVVPLLVQRFVGEEAKGTFYGTLRLWTLMVALLAQALMGMLSDRSALRWGRRRPFILSGTLADLVFIAAIGFSINLEGMTGYWFLFGMLVLLQISSNTAHSAQQGLIPDLVPEDQRGRFSAVKAILEVPLPLILVSFTVGRIVAAGNMWGGILVAMAVVTVSMLLTMLVPEEPLRSRPGPLDWTPFLRLVLMTALFTAVILGVGGIVQGVAHLAQRVSSTTVLLAVMGTAGLLAMVVAVALGVWASVRVSIGAAARQNPSYTWWVVNRLAYLVGANNLAGFAVYFMQARLGLAEEEAAGPATQLMMIVGIFILLSALASGWLADRFGRKQLVALSGIVASLGTAIAISTISLPIIFAGGCLIGIATGLFFTANWALGTDLVPKEEAGRYLGISNLAGAGAGAVGAYIGGPIADYFTRTVPDQPGLGYLLLFAVYGVMFLLSSIALIKVHVTRQSAKIT